MRYKTILADPPWPEHGGGKSKRGADRHYPLMSVRKIAALPARLQQDHDAYVQRLSADALQVASKYQRDLDEARAQIATLELLRRGEK